MGEPEPRRLPRFSLRSLILLVALAGSGYGLWARWEPWGVDRIAYDARPKQFKSFTSSERSSDGERIYLTSARTVAVFDADTSDRIATIELPIRITSGLKIKLYPGDAMLCVFGRQIGPDHLTVKPVYVVFRRNRPEYWWGVAWRPEFWLTLVFGAALLWSVRRDRLGLKTVA